MDQLTDMLERLSKRSSRQKFKQAVLAHGYTNDDYKMFNTLEDSLKSFIESMGCTCAIATHAEHLPSAKATLALCDYLRGAVRFMYGVLTKTGFDPHEFSLVQEPELFYTELDKAEEQMHAVIHKVEAAEALVRSVHSVSSSSLN